MKKLHYYWFAIRWMYLHREWHETRQKYKALNKAWTMHEGGRS